MAIFISENDIEQTCLLVFLHTLHYDEHLNIWQQPDEGNAAFGRVDDTEVVRVAQLRRSLPQLNPGLLDAILATAEAELTRPRDHLTLYEANRAVTMLLQEGCNVPTRNSRGEILT